MAAAGSIPVQITGSSLLWYGGKLTILRSGPAEADLLWTAQGVVDDD
jgi:hypothetical protein